MTPKYASSPIRPPALRRLISCLALLALLAPAEAAAGVSAVDDTGHVVRLDKPAGRIIALYGGFNEILAALGLCDRISARTAHETEPACLKGLPAVGTHLRPNLEMVAGLEPDLVLTLGSRDAAEASAVRLREIGVETAVFRAATFPELFSVMERIGVLTGTKARAGELTASLAARLESTAQRVAGKSRPTVFFEVRYPNLLGAGGTSMVDAVITAAGGRNVLDRDMKLVRISEEALVAMDPDAYLVQQGPMNPSPSHPADRPHFASLFAVRQGRVLFVDERAYSRPGPRSVDAVEKLAAFLHPEPSGDGR